jgi:arylsulfatase A-like enzyme
VTHKAVTQVRGKDWPQPRRPNVLFILTDQMRAEAMGCAGNPVVKTPHLDALAEQGVLFTNAIANCPVCTPSRAMLMTGRYPSSNRTLVNDLPMPTGQPFLAQAFRDAGYKTGYVGKWHLDGLPRDKFTPPGPRRAGFDTYWAAYECHHDYFDPKYYLDTDRLQRISGYEPAVQTDLAMSFMETHKKDPFFLVLAWGPPHDPYHLVPGHYRDLYNPETIPYRPNCRTVNGREYCDYYAQVTALDNQVGRLMAFLDENKLSDDTLVVFTSDHGDMLYSHGRVMKQQPWEESIGIPLIMRPPAPRSGLPRAQRTNILLGMADIAPTIISLAGLTIPTEMEGLDLSGAMLGHGPEHRSLPILEYVPADQAWGWGGREWRGVRTKRYTYARFRQEGWVLYDNITDPYQLDNMIDKPEHRALQKQLEAELMEWLARLNDRFLTADEHLRQLGQYELWLDRCAHFPPPQPQDTTKAG